jgi:hypothetical protein
MLNSQRLYVKLLYYMCLGNGRDGNLTIEAQLVERGPWKKNVPNHAWPQYKDSNIEFKLQIIVFG